MLETTTTRSDKSADNSELQARLSAAAEPTPGSISIAGQTNNEAHVQAGILPALSIDGADANNTHWGAGAMAVTKDLGDGAYDQIIGHPGQVALSGAIGMGIGASVTLVSDGVAAAATAAGVTMAAPEVILGAAAIGIAYGGYELYENAGKWIDDAKTVADQNDYSVSQVAQANTDLQNVGSGGVDVAAGMIGGAAGSYMGGSMVMAEANARAAVTPSLDAPATPAGDAPATTAGDAAATPAGDAPATTAGDAAVAPDKPGDVPAQAAEMTPEKQAVAASTELPAPADRAVSATIGDNQTALAGANDKDAVPATGAKPLTSQNDQIGQPIVDQHAQEVSANLPPRAPASSQPRFWKYQGPNRSGYQPQSAEIERNIRRMQAERAK